MLKFTHHARHNTVCRPRVKRVMETPIAASTKIAKPPQSHVADCGTIVASDQERKSRPIAAIWIKVIPGK